jgi:hypothetical protein
MAPESRGRTVAGERGAKQRREGEPTGSTGSRRDQKPAVRMQGGTPYSDQWNQAGFTVLVAHRLETLFDKIDALLNHGTSTCTRPL